MIPVWPFNQERQRQQLEFERRCDDYFSKAEAYGLAADEAKVVLDEEFRRAETSRLTKEDAPMKTRRWFLRALGLAPVAAPAALEAAMASPALPPSSPPGYAWVRHRLPGGWTPRRLVPAAEAVPAAFRVPLSPGERKSLSHFVDELRAAEADEDFDKNLDALGEPAPAAEPTHNTALACAATARQMRKHRR